MLNLCAKFEVPIFIRYCNTKGNAECTSPVDAEGPRDAPQIYEKSYLKKLAIGEMTFKDTQGHRYLAPLPRYCHF